MGVEIVFSLLGGLGLFLYGMTMMSNGLEKVAGAKMRNILEFFTKNRFVGLLVGTIVTAIIQSSSATTVMVVSFVNSGLMNLMQAAGVIMGANIGTTMTSQLISFNLSEVAPLFVIMGVLMMMMSKKTNVKRMGEVVLGFGILFMGLSTMSGAMSTLKESPMISDLLSSLTNPYLAVLVGFVVTAVLQSSSATVGIVLLLATQGLLQLPICLYIIMGCNIGSCVSALLASIGGKPDAKRAAWIHFLFNIVGTTVMMIVLAVALNPIVAFIEEFSGYNMARCVANAHTMIKVVEVIMLFPFIQFIVKLTYKIIPDRAEKKENDACQLEFIGKQNVFSPTTVVVEITKELERMGTMAITNLTRAMNALVTLDEKDIEEVYKVENDINYLNHAITDYMVSLNQSNLSVDDAKTLGGLFHVVNDIERIGDHAENVADCAKDRKENNVVLSQEAQRELSSMLDQVIKITTYALDMFLHHSKKHLQDILELENQIDEIERKLQQAHVDRLTRNECTPAAGMIYSDIVSGLERVADHATNIAFSILESNPENAK